MYKRKFISVFGGAKRRKLSYESELDIESESDIDSEVDSDDSIEDVESDVVSNYNLRKRKEIIINIEHCETCAIDGYLYMVMEREHLNRNPSKTIVKIGRTQNLNKRFNAYPKGSNLLLSAKISNFMGAETFLKNMFKNKFNYSPIDKGVERFEGDINEMKTEFNECILLWNLQQNGIVHHQHQ